MEPINESLAKQVVSFIDPKNEMSNLEAAKRISKVYFVSLEKALAVVSVARI